MQKYILFFMLSAAGYVNGAHIERMCDDVMYNVLYHLDPDRCNAMEAPFSFYDGDSKNNGYDFEFFVKSTSIKRLYGPNYRNLAQTNKTIYAQMRGIFCKQAREFFDDLPKPESQDKQMLNLPLAGGESDKKRAKQNELRYNYRKNIEQFYKKKELPILTVDFKHPKYNKELSLAIWLKCSLDYLTRYELGIYIFAPNKDIVIISDSYTCETILGLQWHSLFEECEKNDKLTEVQKESIKQLGNLFEKKYCRDKASDMIRTKYSDGPFRLESYIDFENHRNSRLYINCLTYQDFFTLVSNKVLLNDSSN